MTFRIDRIVKREPDGQWEFSIKGFQGRGEYCMLRTGLNGRGLFASRFPPEPGECLLDIRDFAIAPNATAVDARVHLRAALLALGWGPELAETGR